MRRVERAVAGMDVVNNFVCIDVRWTGGGGFQLVYIIV